MANQFLSRQRVFLCLLALTAAAIITAGVFSAGRQSTNQKPQKQVLTLPEVVSHVPKLKIANFSVKNAGTPAAIAVIEILNTSPLAVMSVEISTRNKQGDSGAVNEDGLLDPDKPRVVIPPFGTTTLEMSFSEMVPDSPLVLSAAVFADNSEEGDKWSLDAMRGVRRHRQELIKGGQKGGIKP
jgi:hypothetical protein